MSRSAASNLLRTNDETLPSRLARSAAAKESEVTDWAALHAWIDERNQEQTHEVHRIPFGELVRWEIDQETGNLRHDSGKFFSVEGLRVRTDLGPVRTWTQAIINQPEIGILGILVKEIHGVLHCLMQAKSEPGNVNGVQISPTVQATKSNYTRVHKGNPVPYLDFFRSLESRHVLTDVLQSEQGSWFYRKRNRNMIIEVDEDVEPHPDFRWLTLGQLNELLKFDNLVNMDTRTVLSCMPAGFEGAVGDGTVSLALASSADPLSGSLHTTSEIQSWITTRQSEHVVHANLVPMNSVHGWYRTDDEIRHDTGAFFSVIAVDVHTDTREIDGWSQPLIQPYGTGVVALLVKRVHGVLHALVNARVEPGYLDVVELAPTVQCTPENYDALGLERPPFLDFVLRHGSCPRLFDTELSEEGGRFHQARNRYQIIEVEPDFAAEAPPDYHWLALHQLNGLLQHNNYVNVQARSLIACLRSLR
ncbi:NDP-hexose 2,3-dehydratase family protein [Prauserella cavernicola]|uniref:NDP-hexose 2,3-dehydratase family protein n=1 Tax=Prauserella cavernicola TaxID=2800127 RepID=A0A934V2Y1_9PSEU|nr:NDP-hexose 2,3-dehydratase family protein [Prauserella cavernicola]MBK1786596.1 NDP-hexose 2,3-dehydratase family protein [Prauserella cavernicola]